MKQQFSILLFFAFLASCVTITNYEKPGEPIYLMNGPDSVPDMPDTLVVLSFNIKEAKAIDQAISELQNFSKKHRIDILLLQEMDEAGARQIAKELHLNYLYIPIAYNHMLKHDVGNAILAYGYIRPAGKLILPHTKGVNGRMRHAAVAEVNIGNQSILVYSVHTETSTMKRKKRMDQYAAILKDVRNRIDHYNICVIGGDFNTLYVKDRRELLRIFKEAGFPCVTDTTAFTTKATFGLVKPTMDFIFCKGLQPVSAGRIDSSKASDHLPVYSILSFFP